MVWHIITGEYPPAAGGVSDYCSAVSAGLAAAGDTVHVWCPAADGAPAATRPGVHVHPIAGTWSRADLQRLDSALDRMPSPRRLLVQWVPHAFGQRSLNVGFCRWIRGRGRGGDSLDVMVHEPCFAFREGSVRQDFAAAVHRVMLALLLRSARRVWVSIPAWIPMLRSWAFGRDMPFCWLPVPSTVEVASREMCASSVSLETGSGSERFLIGHFSSYSRYTKDILQMLIPRLLASVPNSEIRLLGRGGDVVAEELRLSLGTAADRVHGYGMLTMEALSCRLQACHLMVQPYQDGASARRTTLMAALAHGLPVATTVGRLSEPIWSRTGAVAAAPAGDVSALVDIVARLAGRRQQLNQMALAARSLYEGEFRIERVISALRADVCDGPA